MRNILDYIYDELRVAKANGKDEVFVYLKDVNIFLSYRETIKEWIPRSMWINISDLSVDIVIWIMEEIHKEYENIHILFSLYLESKKNKFATTSLHLMFLDEITIEKAVEVILKIQELLGIKKVWG